MPLDREKLVKILQRTRGKGMTDADRLASLDAANRMLTDAGVDWTGLVSGSRARVKARGDAPFFVRSSHSVPLVDAIDALEQDGEHWRDDFGKVRDVWIRHKRVTPNDRRAVYDAYERIGAEREEEPE